MDGFLVFPIDGIAHLVTGSAEGQRVRGLHHGVESTPENNAQLKIFGYQF
jgi:hypothetical protein